MGDLPAGGLNEEGAGFGQAIVENVALDVARRLVRFVREVGQLETRGTRIEAPEAAIDESTVGESRCGGVRCAW